MSLASPILAQRRRDAAPFALVLMGWVLAVGPLAHQLLAHGAPFLQHPGDDGWVQHANERGSPRAPARPPAHHHAPGSPEHLQVPLLATAPVTALRAVLVATPAAPLPAWRPVTLPRRWTEEQPQAP